MTKDELQNELVVIQEILIGIKHLSQEHIAIHTLSSVAENVIMQTIMNIVSRDMLIECCKQHWLHGGKCE